MLVAATLIWGGSFVVTRQAVQGVAPLVFVGVRFAVAAILVALATRPALHRMTRTELRGGLAIGAAMVGGYGLQAVGMHMGVPSGRAAFISALYVPMVPLLQMIILRRRPAGRVWAALALAFAGLILLAGPLAGDATSGTVVRGELLVLGGAFAIAAEFCWSGCSPRRWTRGAWRWLNVCSSRLPAWEPVCCSNRLGRTRLPAGLLPPLCWAWPAPGCRSR